MRLAWMEKSKEMPRFQLSIFLSQALWGYTCKLRHVTSDRVTTVTRTWVLKNVFFGWTILISYYWTRLLMELIRDSRKKAPTFMILKTFFKFGNGRTILHWRCKTISMPLSNCHFFRLFLCAFRKKSQIQNNDFKTEPSYEREL